MRVFVRLLIACVLAVPSLATARTGDARPHVPALVLATGTAHLAGSERPSSHHAAAPGVLVFHWRTPAQTDLGILDAAPDFRQARTNRAARGRAPPQASPL